MASILQKAKNVASVPKSSSIEISADLDRKRLGSSNLTLRQKTLLFVICTTYITAVPLRQFLNNKSRFKN